MTVVNYGNLLNSGMSQATQAGLANTLAPENTADIKIQAAKECLGVKYLLHPKNKVQRRPPPLNLLEKFVAKRYRGRQ